MMERNTMQKEIIYSALCSLANHPTAEDVYERVHAEHQSISKATVYRVLNQLAKNGSALKISITNGADCFDHQTHEHHHARCVCCGRVVDMPPFRVDIPQEYFSACDEIEISGYSLQFNGICRDCKRREQGDAQ